MHSHPHPGSGRSAQLQAHGVGFAYGPRTVLRDITLTLAPGDRVGVVGPNGTGKTTLLRLLAQELVPARGTVRVGPTDASVGLMPQQLIVVPGENVAQYLHRVAGIAAVQGEFDAAVAALADGTDDAADRYDRALEQFMRADVAGFEARCEAALDAVGLDASRSSTLTSALSGGQRTRVNLAGVLLASFDVLLLDEPTNDLDTVGLDLLETMVLADDRPLALVSHDRAFLERVVTSVYELDDHTNTGTRFNGGFAAWQAARETARRHHEEAYHEYQDKRAELRSRAATQHRWSEQGVRRARNDRSEQDKFVRNHRIESSEKVASKARQTERALERLERNEKVDAPWQPWELRLDFSPAERSGSEVAVLRQAVVERGEFRLGPVSTTVIEGDRILITGDNGSGKTTLLQMLLGELALTSGAHALGPSVRVGVLRQQRALFHQAPSLLRGFTDAVGCDDPTARSQLAKLGLDSGRIDRPAAALSPGEQTRAALALFAARGSNLLVLDEPTNHLDLPAIEQLEVAIGLFPHTVLLVTHDRRLIANSTMTRRWHLSAGRLAEVGWQVGPFDGLGRSADG